MANRLPFYTIDSCEVLKNVLKEGVILTEKQYRSPITQSCTLKSCNLEANEVEDAFTNILLTLDYVKNANKLGRFTPVDVSLKLKVLCGLGDREWGYRSKIKVWDGDYPSTVGIDINTGNVYLIYVRENRIDLVEFGEMNDKELEAFEDSFNDREPFEIGLDANTLFAYLDGEEGYNYLKDNVYIDFKCCSTIRVYSKFKK